MLARRVAVFILLLAGCSRTPAPVADANNTIAPAASVPSQATALNAGVDTHSAQPSRAGLPVIAAFGDSLTAGYGLEPGQSYPDFLQRDLDRDGYHVRVVNLGVSGNTTKDGVARLQDALRLHPAVAIVGFGGNDGLRGIPAAEMQRSLATILTAFQRAHIPVVMGGITLPPNYGQAYIQKFNAVFPALAAQYKVPLLPFMLQGIWNEPGMVQDDGIHPTAEGAQLLAKNFVPLVEPLLKKY